MMEDVLVTEIQLIVIVATPHIETAAIDPAMTHHINHIADHPHLEVLQLTNPEITIDHTQDHPTNLQSRTHTDQVHIPADHEENHTSRT